MGAGAEQEAAAPKEATEVLGELEDPQAVVGGRGATGAELAARVAVTNFHRE